MSSTTSSNELTQLLPSQVLSVTKNLPTPKILDNLTKNQRILQNLPQNYEKRHFFTGLYKSLLDDFFYTHERSDVQLYTAICLADIIRIWAPNLPDGPTEKLIKMFKFLARQLSLLKRIDDPLFNRRYYLLENLSLVQTFIPAIALEENNSCEISSVVLTNIFNGVHEKQTDQLKLLMIDIVSVILAEYEPVPIILIELLFARIVDPEKKLRAECYDLVKSIIRQGESFLKQPIAEYFKMVLVTGDTDDLYLHGKIYNIFDELTRISWSIVDGLIPTIEHRLNSENEKFRRDAVKLLAFITSSAKNDFARRYENLWKKFLDQFKNGTTEIQLTCMKYLKSFFVNHPELGKDLEDVMANLSLSTDANIRGQLMLQLRSITNSNLFDVTEKIKEIFCQRARDKIWEVRKETLEYLAQVYRKECSTRNWSDEIQKKLIWISNCIIHLYFQKSIQDKILAERLLTFYLLPWDSEVQEKVRVFFELYTNVSENAQRAIRDIIHSKFLFRRQLIKIVELSSQMSEKTISNDEKQLTEIKLVNVIHGLAQRWLPMAEKNEPILKALVIFMIKQEKQKLNEETNRTILSLFKRATSDEIKSKECFALAENVQQILLDESNKEQNRFPNAEQNNAANFVKISVLTKILFEKISTILFDRQTVSELLKTIFERVSNENELTSSFFENVNQLLKVFIQHPFIFDCLDSLDFLRNLLKEHSAELALILLRIIEGCAPLIIGKNDDELFETLENEVSSYLTKHPSIGKRALYCLSALHPNDKDEFLKKIVEQNDYEEFDNEEFLTRLTLLGHAVVLCPTAVGEKAKTILNKISNFIEEKNSDSFLHGRFTLMADEPHADPEIGGETRAKRELIKALTRSTIGLRENSSNLFALTYKFIRKSIEQDPDFTEGMSEHEIIEIRICGLSCLLKLISNAYFSSRIKGEDFLLIVSLLRDPSSTIRKRTYRKLAENLRDPQSPIEFLSLLAFAAKEPEQENREQIRRSMLQIIDTRREQIKLQLNFKASSQTQSDDDDKPIDYTFYPEYSLSYFLFFLSKSPAFILYDDVEMLHTMTEYILFLLDALLLHCDATVGLFYKGLLKSMKSCEDATISPDKQEKAERKDALKKLHVLVDLTYVILSQRAASLMICRATSDVPLNEQFFIKTRYDSLCYLPKDFKIKLKPISNAAVNDLNLINDRIKSNQSEPTTSTITIRKSSSAKSSRKKRTQIDEQNSTTKKQRTSLPEKRNEKFDESDDDSPIVQTDFNEQDDANQSQKQTTTEQTKTQKKRQLRYDSSSSSS